MIMILYLSSVKGKRSDASPSYTRKIIKLLHIHMVYCHSVCVCVERQNKDILNIYKEFPIHIYSTKRMIKGQTEAKGK